MKKKGQRLCCGLCAVALLGGIAAPAAFAAQPRAAQTVAEWKFDQASVQSGSLGGNDLVLRDASGNGNHLRLTGSGANLSFTDDRMYDGTGGSLQFNNPKGVSVFGKKAEFLTIDSAPVNRNSFADGYTVEMIYQLPADFTDADKWMGLLSRKGSSASMTEVSGVTMSLAVSNCKELQYLTANAADSHEMDSAWSISMDKGGVWYHVVITSDGHTIRTFVNGCESFRDYASDEMAGMYADPRDGRFCIGGYDSGFSDRAGRGTIQQIRLSEGVLDKSQWLISNPEQYIGQYGSNQPFSITAGGAYNLVFLPDIQNAVQFRKPVVDTAVDWLIDHQADVNLAAVLSLGDNVNWWTDSTQWETAGSVLKKLPEAGVRFLPQPGNHDYGGSAYLDMFGPDSEIGALTRKTGVVYSPSGYSGYQIFEGGSYQYMMLTLSMHHIQDTEEAAWFTGVLQAHPNLPTIVSSHDVQNCDAAAPERVHLSGNGQLLWNLVKPYDQVFLMVGGHSHGAGEEILTNDAGHPVFSVLADYQFAYNGGNAFFKFAEFDEAHNQIKISTFSPYAATLKDSGRTFFDVNYMDGPGNYTVFDLDFSARFAGAPRSAQAELQQEIISLVRGIDALPDEVTLADQEAVAALAARFSALPAEDQADFANTQKLLDAQQRIEDILSGKITPEEPSSTQQTPSTAPSTAPSDSAGSSSNPYTGDARGESLAVAVVCLAGCSAVLLRRRKRG